MHLQLLVIQTLKNSRDASPKFPATFSLLIGGNADDKNPKTNALIIIFNHQTCFSVFISYHSCKNYIFLNIIINFYSFMQKLKKVYKHKKLTN